LIRQSSANRVTQNSATEAKGKPRIEPASDEPQLARRHVQLFVWLPKADAPAWFSEIPTSPIEKLNAQSVGFILTGTHLGLAKLYVTHSR